MITSSYKIFCKNCLFVSLGRPQFSLFYSYFGPESGHKETIFYKIFLRTGNPKYLGGKKNTKLFTKLTKYGRGKLHSFETGNNAQACNVSYQSVTKNGSLTRSV